MNKRISIGTFYFILLVSLISVLSVKDNEMVQFSYAIISHNETAFVTNMELMKGHLEQAIVNKEKGNTSLAEAHITHPIEEIFFMIDDMLSNKNIELNNSLSQSLSDTISIAKSSTPQEFTKKIDDNYKLIDQSINEVIPDRDNKFNLAVIGKIMNTAKEEYNEGVINEKVENILEYQDSLGFVSRAIDLYDSMDIKSEEPSTKNISSSSVGEELNTLQEMMTNQTDASYVVEKILDMTDQISSITGVPFNELTSTGVS